MSAGYTIQEINSDLTGLQSVNFVGRNEPNFSLGQIQSTLSSLPALRGLWASSIDNAGSWQDSANNGLHLTNNNNAEMGFVSNTLIPRFRYDGSTEYHSRPDEADFDITGTEVFVPSSQRGLSVGAWVRFDNAASGTEIIASKFSAAAGNRSWNINRQATGMIRFTVSVDGTAITNVDSVSVASASTWYFVAGRFTASSESAIWLNDEKTINTTSIPASIFNSNAAFEIASNGGGNNFMDGLVSFTFLCACALSDAHMFNIYQQSRGLFGV